MIMIKYLNHKQQLINKRLSSLLVPTTSKHKTLYDSMNYSLLLEGKRIRPVLFLIILEMLGVEAELYMDVACAIECIHTYSLIHDDLPCMDNDDYRRGKPTNHKIFGEAIAVLAGDGLLTYAFQLLVENQQVNASKKAQLVYLLSKAAGPSGMVGGQAQDIEAEEKNQSLKDLQIMDTCKTGKLLTVAVDMASYLAGSDILLQQTLHEFSIHLGILFQITDDLLDINSTLVSMGKDANRDTLLNKSTYVTELGVEGAQKMANQEAELALNSLSKINADTSLLKQLVHYILNRKE